MTSNETKTLELLESVTQTVLLLGCIFVDGYVVMRMWAWFVHPLGVAPLGYGAAIGISTFAGVLTSQYSKSEKSDTWSRIFSAYGRSGIALLIGYVAR